MTLAIEQVVGHGRGDTHVHAGDVLPLAGHADAPHHVQRDRFGGLHPTGPRAARTFTEDALEQAGPLPLVLTGDFNCNAWSPIYQRLLGEGFIDTYRAAGLPDTTEASTFHGFRGREYFALEWGDQLHWRVDWILTRDAGTRLLTTACAIVRDAEPPVYASDHYPVVTDIRVQA